MCVVLFLGSKFCSFDLYVIFYGSEFSLLVFVCCFCILQLSEFIFYFNNFFKWRLQSFQQNNIVSSANCKLQHFYFFHWLNALYFFSCLISLSSTSSWQWFLRHDNKSNKNKNKTVGLHQIKKLLHRKRNKNRVNGKLYNGRKYLQAIHWWLAEARCKPRKHLPWITTHPSGVGAA
jgi:hypothetical protein